MTKKFKPDEIDLAILSEIRENSKQSARKLAEKIGVHPNTIMQRMKTLENEKVILKYSTDIDYRKVGYEIHGLILMRLRKGRAGEAWRLDQIRKLPQIQAMYALTGNYDVAALLRTKDRDEMTKILQQISAHPDVIRTNTSLMLYAYKQPYDFNPLWMERRTK